MKKRLSVILTAIILLMPVAKAQTDSISISLLTCEPGKAIYELYGHTALLVEDFRTGTELVYNYGMFDFNTPNFMLKFTRGHTDYILGINRYSSFLREYDVRGSRVFKQTLNLSKTELRTLDSLLRDNIKPENRTYRYNFLYNNCATMALDKIEQSIQGTVSYPETDTTLTLRNILTAHTSVRPWSEFAVDIILGSEIDRPLKYKQETFAPLCLMGVASKAVITDNTGIQRPLVLKTETVADPDHHVDMGKPLFTPVQVAGILATLVLLLSLLGRYREKRYWLIDALLYGAQGISGIIITFMYFFSEHPAVGTNWLTIVFNPIPLFLIPFMAASVRRNKAGLLTIYEFIVCTAFLICAPFIPQHIEPAVHVLTVTFAARAALSILFCIHMRQHPSEPQKKHAGRVASLFLLMVTLPAALQAGQEQRPKLVVGIVIDQFDEECLSVMMPQLTDDGLLKIWIDGYNRPNATFDFDDTDCASAIASIYTGASPFQHGIVAGKWMNRKTLIASSPIDDGSCNGINTIEHSSPKRLLATNLADEMKLGTDGRSKVCSIAAQREASVLAGGHEADLAIWINKENYAWCSSDYYGKLPEWVSGLNDSIFKKSTWEPLLPAARYQTASGQDLYKPFSYTFKRNTPVDYTTSPLANDRVNDAAIAAVDAMELGSDDTPDLLTLTYYAGNFRHEPNSIWTIEQQDIYLRLDRNIAQLIKEINNRVGAGNVLYFLTSTGYTDCKKPRFENTRIPSGTVSMERTAALLNLYLSSKYGSEKYVETFYSNQIYLNHNLIEDNGLSMHEVLENSVDLLVQVSGIKNVILLRNLMSMIPDAEAARKRNSFNSAYTGDIIIDAIPGWGILDESEGVTYYRKPTSSPIPFILYGNGIRAEINHEPISVSVLIPTVCNIVGCGMPNASYCNPLINLK